MVGAERPSVTTALSALAREGLVTRTPTRGWLLNGPVPDDVGELLTRPEALRGR
jgi:DNA-binding GntR family transcriptional regulator